MDPYLRTTFISTGAIELIQDIGEISNLIQMRDMIKFGPNESFKDRLRTNLENVIDHLCETTKFYLIPYVEVEDAEEQDNIDINIILSRLFYTSSHLIGNAGSAKSNEGLNKKINKDIKLIIFYVKLICLQYDIDYSKFLKSAEECSASLEWIEFYNKEIEKIK